MKLQNGFISNSSSTSFILYKNNLTDLQLIELRELVDSLNESDSCDTGIDENETSFCGSIGYYSMNDMLKYLLKNKIKDFNFAEM